MEAKEKARYLVDVHLFQIASVFDVNMSTNYIKCLKVAKKSALICVKERLNEIDEYFEATKGQVEVLALWNYNVGKQRYWQEVEKEIEKL